MMLVPDSTNRETWIACYQVGESAPGALPAPAFAAFREGLTTADQAHLHIIWIPAKMGYGRKAAVQDALLRLAATPGGGREAVALFGAQQLAILHHNVLAWEGPSLAGIAPTPDAIDRLDPDEPLTAFVLAEVARRNPLRRSGDPKAPGVSGSFAAGAQPSPAHSVTRSEPSTSTLD